MQMVSAEERKAMEVKREELFKAQLDVHIEAWIDKIFSRIGWDFDQTPYTSLADLTHAFDGLADAPGTFDWRGIELFWARNKGT